MSESQNVDVTGDAIAKCVLDKFNSLPKKRKPLQQGNVREWVPLAGVVAELPNGTLRCISLGTGMKCLPHASLPTAAGCILHDWHAEILALRSFNRFILDELISMIFLGSPWKAKSDILRYRPLLERRLGPVFTIREDVKLHFYCSEAPCGDASMELTMSAQEDATPWELPSAAGLGVEKPALPGRANFQLLGVVRRKPARPDAPETRSKSCSDKLAAKQYIGILNSVTALYVDPRNAYLSTFTVPRSQYVPEAFERCFGPMGRLAQVAAVNGHSKERLGRAGREAYAYHAFRILTTNFEFEFSRRGRGDGIVKPSNIAAHWNPYQEETIIGGVLQGYNFKKVGAKAASSVSRRRMWEALMELESYLDHDDKRNEKIDESRPWKDLKMDDRLLDRRDAKELIRKVVLMKGEPWVENRGDDDWALVESKDP